MWAHSTKSLTLIEMAALLGLALLAFCYLEYAGEFSRHMIVHIALMTGIAPLIASRLAQRRALAPLCRSNWMLLAAALAQLVLFFGWHSPPGMHLAMMSLVGELAMQASLLAVAIWFWLCVLNYDNNIWPQVAALLVTGKLYCLVAILLVFAPRTIYGMSGMHGGMTLVDQQLAGLLMVVACPMTYVLAAIVLVARWFQSLFGSEPQT